MRKFIAAVALATTLCSCSWFSDKGTVAKGALIDCAKQDLGATVTEAGVSLLMTVVSILATSGTDWKAGLDALEGKYGADAVACAVHVAEELFRQAPATNPQTSMGADAAHDRAQQLIDAKGWSYR